MNCRCYYCSTVGRSLSTLSLALDFIRPRLLVLFYTFWVVDVEKGGKEEFIDDSEFNKYYETSVNSGFTRSMHIQLCWWLTVVVNASLKGNLLAYVI